MGPLARLRRAARIRKLRKEPEARTLRDSQTAIALPEHMGLRVLKKNRLKTIG